MGRHDQRYDDPVRIFAALAILLSGCEGPPGAVHAPDAPVALDAPRAPDAPPRTDGATIDAAPIDAPRADARSDAARPADASPDASPDDPFGIHLTDVTWASIGVVPAGITMGDTWGIGSGAALGDLDGDGDLDLFVARDDDPLSTHSHGPSTIYWNNGASAGGFPTFSPDAPLELLFAGVLAHGVALGDFDGDGDLDVFVACEGRDFLLENDGAGDFTDVTDLAGVAGRDDDKSVGAMFVDLNHDGLLDLYVDDHTAAGTPFPDDRAANRLYLNLGDGTFEDVSDASGTANTASTQTSGAADLDGTGDLVLYLANDRFAIDGASVFGMPDPLPGDAYYRLTGIDDQGVPSFVDVAAAEGVLAERSSMGLAFADVDGDLTPDVYVTDWGESDLYLNPTPGGPSLTPSTFYQIGLRHDPFGDLLIHWGARFVDLDRDGLYEVFAVQGGLSTPVSCVSFHQLDYLLREPAAGVPYVSITSVAGLPWPPACFAMASPIVGRGLVEGDLDGDGDDDFVVTPYAEPYRVYRNDTPAVNHVLRARLVGTVSAIDPIGASLVVTRSDGMHLARFRTGGADLYSQSDTPIEVGLGSSTSVASAVITWPSGLVQRIDGLPWFAIDTTLTIVEPAWLTLSARVVGATDPTPVITYTAVDGTGAPLGAAGAGHAVTITRSDGVAVSVTDVGDGTYTAPLPHPGVVRRTVLTIVVDGVTLRPRPMINYE
jgi:hypothetical protein